MHTSQTVSSTLDELLSTSCVARELDCSENNVRRLADLGVLKCVRTSTGQRLFRRHEIVRLREERSAVTR